MYNKFVTKVNTIDSTRYVLQTQYNSDKSGAKKIDNADKKISDTSGLVIKQIIMTRSLKLKTKYLVLLA